MLYSPQQFARDQLIGDLTAVRDRLRANWLKGGWQAGANTCIVAAVQLVTEQPVGHTTIPQGTQVSGQVRLGRALVAVYMALYGPKAPQDLTLGQVMSKIISFNDGAANHGSVLLLFDRAIAAVAEQAGATVTAGG